MLFIRGTKSAHKIISRESYSALNANKGQDPPLPPSSPLLHLGRTRFSSERDARTSTGVRRVDARLIRISIRDSYAYTHTRAAYACACSIPLSARIATVGLITRRTRTHEYATHEERGSARRRGGGRPCGAHKASPRLIPPASPPAAVPRHSRGPKTRREANTEGSSPREEQHLALSSLPSPPSPPLLLPSPASAALSLCPSVATFLSRPAVISSTRSPGLPGQTRPGSRSLVVYHRPFVYPSPRPGALHRRRCSVVIGSVKKSTAGGGFGYLYLSLSLFSFFDNLK